MQVESAVSLGAKCKERTSPQDLAHGKLVTQGDAYAVKKDRALLHKSEFKEEKCKSSKQDPFCHETLLKNSDQENIYLLDATKEGNVGRFLNVSKKCACSTRDFNFKK